MLSDYLVNNILALDNRLHKEHFHLWQKNREIMKTSLFLVISIGY